MQTSIVITRDASLCGCLGICSVALDLHTHSRGAKLSWKIAPATSNMASYSDRPSRITKPDLFMVLALWMEDFSDLLEDNQDTTYQSRHKKVGAAIVSPNDILYAVDCTRDGVHGVARLLMNNHDIAKGCTVFVSRKPCSFCAKLLVQSKVERVFFPPFEPEYYDGSRRCTSIGREFKREKSRVDILFQTSNIGQSVFVPTVAKAVLECEKRKHKPKDQSEAEGTMDNRIGKKTTELFDKFWKENWIKTVKENLSWPAFDQNLKEQVKQDFENTMRWMARILVQSGLDEDEITFKKVKSGSVGQDNFKTLDFKIATHLIRMAQFLAGRTDDPKRGVGAVIANEKMEIKALGWNGFPLKARYGEFPRASDDDDKIDGKKYPFIIHAEQGALLYRNDKNLKDGTLFVTKTPCDECTPLLHMEEIKTVFLGAELQKKKSKDLSYLMFEKKVEKGVFICFEKREDTPTEKTEDTPLSPTKKRKKKK